MREYFKDEDIENENLVYASNDKLVTEETSQLLDFVWMRQEVLGQELWNYQMLAP